MKSEQALKEITEFCKEHPELRFWQALSALTERRVSLAKLDKTGGIVSHADTFYFNELRK
jgi:hypothetical protein